MIPGMNPRQLAHAMKRLGIQQTEIPATEVIIKTPDSEIVILEPQVSKVNMMGQETFQIVGKIYERAKTEESSINDEDVKTVMEQAGVSKEKATAALKKANGDLAKAIMDLQE
jgi:nascent polypeptide-associated complex subunit alpha